MEPRINDMFLPPVPPMIDSLPILAGEESDCEDNTPTPTCLPARRQHGKNAALVEILSRRLSRHTLIQQRFSSSTTSSLPRFPSPPHSQPSTFADKLPSSGPLTMEIDSDSNYAAPDPSILEALTASRSRRGRRDMSRPTVPETKVGSSAAARVLERLQSNAKTTSDNNWKPAVSQLATLPDIEIDTSDKINDLEADEGYAATDDDLSWLERELPSGVSLAGTLKSRGVLQFNTSAETALRCPKLVKNVPRMRKRQQKKKEHRLKAAAAAANGESHLSTGIMTPPALQSVR